MVPADRRSSSLSALLEASDALADQLFCFDIHVAVVNPAVRVRGDLV